LEKEGNIGQKYLVGKHMLAIGEVNQIVSEVSGVPLPWLSMPNAMVTASAALLTGLADLIKRPPLWGMSRDQMRTMKEGFRGDGSKAERELGLVYTPIRQAIAEEVAFYRGT
jgi:dihydroflavonol-4-reductase